MCALDDLVLRFRCALEGGHVHLFLVGRLASDELRQRRGFNRRLRGSLEEREHRQPRFTPSAAPSWSRVNRSGTCVWTAAAYFFSRSSQRGRFFRTRNPPVHQLDRSVAWFCLSNFRIG